MKTEKPQAECVRESVAVLQKLRDLGIPLDSAEVKELKQHLDAYVKEGECWSGRIAFLPWSRIAEVNLPRRADRTIEVTLRFIKLR